MKLFFGTIQGNRYVLEISDKRTLNNLGYQKCDADIKVVDKDGELVHSFERPFSDKWGPWNDDGIKRSMLDEVREDLS